MRKGATTVRLPEESLRRIRAIAAYENRTLADIFTEFADTYIEAHVETLELLRIPGFLDECREGLQEIKSGGGKRLDELDG